MARRTIPLPFAVDLARSMRLLRLGRGDPTIHVADGLVLRASRTPGGPSTLRAQHRGDHLDVEAWGEGAEWSLEHAPALLGCLDDREGFDPDHPIVRGLHRRAEGLRLPRSGQVLPSLLPAVLSQRVTGFEAKRAYRLLVERWGEPAPGPGGLLLPPAPETISDLGYYDLHVIGVEKKRADALKRVSAHAVRLEATVGLPASELRARLEAIPGVGPWTSAEVSRVVLGDADAVSVGDHRLKDVVSWALASEPRGTDARMLELLEPFAGHRGRVCVLLQGSGITAPKYGPRARIEPMAQR
jgi:3-methyladenine DNA glycosylase/8-oxoguanine DNA glycosylase